MSKNRPRTILPKRLRNEYSPPEFLYVGSASELRFEGSDITGFTGLNIYSGEDKRVPVVRSKSPYRTAIISHGQLNNRRDFGYRKHMIGDAANSQILLSDDVLDFVFGSIEKRLMEAYALVFESVKKETESEHVKGEVVKVSAGSSPSSGSATLYDVKDCGGKVHRLAVKTYTDLLKEGDSAEFDFVKTVLIWTDREAPAEILPGNVQVLEFKEEYFKILGWRKIK